MLYFKYWILSLLNTTIPTYPYSVAFCLPIHGICWQDLCKQRGKQLSHASTFPKPTFQCPSNNAAVNGATPNVRKRTMPAMYNIHSITTDLPRVKTHFLQKHITRGLLTLHYCQIYKTYSFSCCLWLLSLLYQLTHDNFTLDFDFVGLSLPIIGAMISQYLLVSIKQVCSISQTFVWQIYESVKVSFIPRRFIDLINR